MYKTVWTPFIGEELPLKAEDSNVSTCGSWPRPRHYTTRRLFETRRLLPLFGCSPPATKRGRRLFDAGVYSRKYGTHAHAIRVYEYQHTCGSMYHATHVYITQPLSMNNILDTIIISHSMAVQCNVAFIILFNILYLFAKLLLKCGYSQLLFQEFKGQHQSLWNLSEYGTE